MGLEYINKKPLTFSQVQHLAHLIPFSLKLLFFALATILISLLTTFRWTCPVAPKHSTWPSPVPSKGVKGRRFEQNWSLAWFRTKQAELRRYSNSWGPSKHDEIFPQATAPRIKTQKILIKLDVQEQCEQTNCFKSRVCYRSKSEWKCFPSLWQLLKVCLTFWHV